MVDIIVSIYPEKWTAAFLYDGITKLFLDNNYPALKEKFIVWLKAYYEKSQLFSIDNYLFTKTQFNQSLKDPTDDFAKKVEKFIETNEPDLVKFLQINPYSKEGVTEEIETQRESILLLVNLLVVNEQSPSIEISPDFDKNNPDSPLLCMINLTVTSAIQLQSTLHGSKTLPSPCS